MTVELVMGVLKGAADLFAALKQSARAAIAQALITATLLLVTYVSVYMLRDRSMVLGLRDVFAPGVTVVHEDPSTMQAELRQVAASDKMIRQLLRSVLGRAPNAARARLAVIHNGVTGVSGLGMLRFDITHAEAVPGRDPGPVVQNQPMTNWGDYIGTLLAGQCTTIEAATLQSAAARMRMADLNIRTVLACPVVDPLSRTLGALFLSWDGHDDAPSGADMRKLMDDARDTGRQIALALDLRPQN